MNVQEIISMWVTVLAVGMALTIVCAIVDLYKTNKFECYLLGMGFIAFMTLLMHTL